jgi:hypothetical protein
LYRFSEEKEAACGENCNLPVLTIILNFSQEWDFEHFCKKKFNWYLIEINTSFSPTIEQLKDQHTSNISTQL